MAKASSLEWISRPGALVALALAALAGGAWAQTGVHPGYSLTPLRPTGFEPRISGMDFLPDGRMVICTWDDFSKTLSSVYLLSNVETGDRSKVTFKKIAGNLYETLGLKVVDGKIYVLEKHQLSLLENTDTDDSIETVKKVASGWQLSSTLDNNLEFAFGLPFRNGKFYVGLATAWPVEMAQSELRGSFLEIDAVTGAYTTYAAGVRTPDGMVLGPENELFATENQGNWVPSSKMVHVKQGRFFGVKKQTATMPFQNSAVIPPVVWMPHGNVSVSPTQPVYLKEGLFAGQMIVGDNRMGTLKRIFLEKVGGEFQGAVFPFSAGLEAGGHRIEVGPDKAVYIGQLGVLSDVWPDWSWSSRQSGLQRLAPNGKAFFDWMAVRSKGEGLIELEFNQPLASGADQASKYTVRQWGFVPSAAYGAGNGNPSSVSVKGAVVSSDKRRVTLSMDGLKTGNLIHIKVSGLTAEGNVGNLWSTESWYTLNKVGPGVDVIDTSSTALAAAAILSGDFTAFSAAGNIRLDIPFAGRFRAEIRDIRGNLRETFEKAGPGVFTGKTALPAGMYSVSVAGHGIRKTRQVAVLAR